MVRILSALLSIIVTCSYAFAVEYDHHPKEKPLEDFWGGMAPKAFEHALVFNGIGLDFGVHLGVLDALIDADKKPDLIIGTCGGAVTAGVHKAFPDREARLAFMTSPEFHQFIVAPYAGEEQNAKKNKKTYLKVSIQSFLRKWNLRNKVLNYFPYKMANLPQDAIPSELSGEFQEVDGIKYITLAARTSLTPENIADAKIRGQKYYDEVLFTDHETAEIVKNYTSPIASYFPKSLVRPGAIVKSDQNIGTAIRLGVSDPFIFEPGKFSDGYYLTGGINLNPVELAQGAAKEVTFLFRNGFDRVFDAITDGGAFGYDTRDRQKLVSSRSLDRWVDLTDRDGWENIGFSVTKGLTSDYEEFKRMILKQYIIGYYRASEAACLPYNNKGHIRNLDGNTTHARVRNSISRKHRLDNWICVKIQDLQAKLESQFAVDLPDLNESLLKN